MASLIEDRILVFDIGNSYNFLTTVKECQNWSSLEKTSLILSLDVGKSTIDEPVPRESFSPSLHTARISHRRAGDSEGLSLTMLCIHLERTMLTALSSPYHVLS